MPYLDPELILDRFAVFTREEVRPAVADDEFVHAQVGSMASTLQFLAGEVGGREAAVRTQRRALRESLDDLESVLVRADIEAMAVRTAIAAARSDADAAEGSIRDVEEMLLTAANDVLATIDEELEAEQAVIARQPLYDFLHARVDQQLRLLGREGDE
jgi:signal recognition particle GTPase